MSERELRNKYAQHAGPCSFIMDFGHRPDLPRKECDCGLREALALNPDVVAVLHLLRALPEEIQSALTTDDRILIGVLCNAIGRKFGVRLTDDGYEWVEDEK